MHQTPINPSDIQNWKVVPALPLVQALPLVLALHPKWYRIPPIVLQLAFEFSGFGYDIALYVGNTRRRLAVHHIPDVHAHNTALEDADTTVLEEWI